MNRSRLAHIFTVAECEVVDDVFKVTHLLTHRLNELKGRIKRNLIALSSHLYLSSN